MTAMDAEQWTVDANESVRLSLVRAEEDKAVLTTNECYEGFHPTFTYPIYGEDEKLYGYKDLAIDLKFASGSLTTFLGVTYSEKLPASTAVDDPEATLAKFIPKGYLKDPIKFAAAVEADALSFRPLGERIHSYTRVLRNRTGSDTPSTDKEKGKSREQDGENGVDGEEAVEVEYEVYHCTWDTPGFKEYHRRMQIFVLCYIEGASYIKEDEEGWEFVLLYEKRRRRSGIETYHLVGYSTLFPFYYFPEKVRMRLSQFIIILPYQGEGHGSALYSAIYQYVLSQPHIAELTVEDPAEAFEDLRDRCDLRMLLGLQDFMREGFGDEAEGHSVTHGNGRGKGKVREKRGKIGPPVDKAWLEKSRMRLKIASRQFHRLTEMLQLRHINATDPRQMKAYRLQVKERLYRFNFEVLMQLDKEERQAKLEETFQGVCRDYERIMAPFRLSDP